MINRLSIKFFWFLIFLLSIFLLKLWLFLIFMQEKAVPVGCAPTFVVSKIFAINLKMYFWHTDNISLRKNTKLVSLGFVKHTHKNCVLCASFGPDLGGSFKRKSVKLHPDSTKNFVNFVAHLINKFLGCATTVFLEPKLQSFSKLLFNFWDKYLSFYKN